LIEDDFKCRHFSSDEFSSDLGRFFTELGSGSPEEVPDTSADDETAEQQARRYIYFSSRKMFSKQFLKLTWGANVAPPVVVLL
jgi:hypothetical protein